MYTYLLRVTSGPFLHCIDAYVQWNVII